MSPLPLGLGGLVRALLPDEFADDVVGGLEERFAARRREGRVRAAMWLTKEVATTPFIGLHRQAWRLRARGVRRRESIAAGGRGWIDGRLIAGLLIAVRSLKQRPGFTTVAVLTLAVSVGASTLIFSLFEGVLLRPLPYPAEDRLHLVYGLDPNRGDDEEEVVWDTDGVSQAMIDSWRAGVSEIEGLAAYYSLSDRWEDGRSPTVTSQGAFVQSGFFETLGLEPVLGRFPTGAEFADGDSVIVVSDRLWRTRYGESGSVLGQTVRFRNTAYTIVGVAPSGLGPEEGSDWWTTLGGAFGDAPNEGAFWRVVVRLSEGAEADAVQTRMTKAVEALAESSPVHAGMGAHLLPLRAAIVDDARAALRVFLAAVVFIVLIASINLANLVLVRASHQRSELAMRAALGASRRDLLWVTLSEVVVLSVVGGGLGVLLATRALEPFVGVVAQSADMVRMGNVGMNATVLLFATGVTVLVVTLVGLLPGLAASRYLPWEAMQQSRRGSRGMATRRTQRVLLFVESVMTIVVLAFGGWLVSGSWYFLTVDTGFDREEIAVVEIRPSWERYPTHDDVLAFSDAVRGKLTDDPAITELAWSETIPGFGGSQLSVVRAADSEADGSAVSINRVSPEFLDVLGMELTAGRGFTAGDSTGAQPVVILSESLAQDLFGNKDPLGRTALISERMTFEGSRAVALEEETVEVIGVVGDVRHVLVALDPVAIAYRPIQQSRAQRQAMLLRTEGEPEEAIDVARAAVLEVDSLMYVGYSEALKLAVQRPMANWHVATLLMATFAALACLLTVVGIFGVVSYVVSDQVREIGLRIALGARTTGEKSRVVVGALKPVLAGAALGLIGVIVFDVLDEDSVGAPGMGPLVYVAVFGILIGAAALAAWLPARRAAAVDPARVLSEVG